MQQIPLTIEQILENLKPILILGFSGFALAMLFTPIYTNFAFRYQWWKRQRSDTVSGEKAAIYHKMHAEKHKRHIPTMAGIIGLLALTVVTLVGNFDRGQTWLPLAAAVGAGLVGLLDDVINLRGKGLGTAGLNFKFKLLLTTLVAAALSYWFVYKLGYTSVHIPFGGEITLAASLMFMFYVFVIIATANAVNITDGLDGLAGGLLVTAYAAFGLIAILQGNFGIAGFCLTMIGVLLSYLWFNIFPARFFMGDVGSFAFGATLAVVAIMLNATLLIPIIGLIFVAEVTSVVIQLFSKKFLHRKVFLSAPIHHHFEATGWPETKVTMRFWVLGQVAAVVGLLVAVLGGFLKL
ncbi:phospho-N-acetylmuramoyl-pentapeptide-transferase [Candidatus Saccharibacteria bacterium]|nr:phospho-N-acetylmuramoyl-pentapeptide-transferase [Candidatus Saccharibacteria bacterium]